MTAFGTVGAVIVAVGIALWSEWRSGKRIAHQWEHEQKALEDERKHSREQLVEERRLVREREQLSEAYCVQVLVGETDLQAEMRSIATIIVNRGRYTITGIEARLHLFGGRLIEFPRQEGFYLADVIDESMTTRDLDEPFRIVLSSTDRLTPGDVGTRFVTDPMSAQPGSYPIVRWTDRWGTRWEHQLGEVREIHPDSEWQLQRPATGTP